MFTHGHLQEYCNELIRLQSGEIVYSYGMRLCCDPENRPYSSDNFLCKKVIGEFVCSSIECFDVPYPAFQSKLEKRIIDESCCTYYQLHRYAYHDALYGWHITDLVIYDRPKELSDFAGLRKTKFGMEPVSLARPPQSWCYVEEINNGKDG